MKIAIECVSWEAIFFVLQNLEGKKHKKASHPVY